MTTKVHRVFSLNRGHLVLAGLPSVGRKSVCKLASFVEDMNITRLEITKNFGILQFRTKMKQVYELAAYNGRDKLKTVFLLEETDIVREEFLEDIQNVLASGLVPNLYSNDDLARVRDECKMAYKMAGNTEEIPEKMNEFFYRRVQDNLHLAYIVSSTLQEFSVACRSFPALINNAAFIFYNPWPNEGLYEVAYRFLCEVQPLPEGAEKAIARVCTEFYDQTMTTLALKIKTTMGRPCDLLPSHYTAFLETYKVILD